MASEFSKRGVVTSVLFAVGRDLAEISRLSHGNGTRPVRRGPFAGTLSREIGPEILVKWIAPKEQLEHSNKVQHVPILAKVKGP